MFENRVMISETLNQNVPLIYLVGQECLKIQNYKKILQYNQKEMIFLLSKKILCIKGENLNLEYFNEDEICIQGHIVSITYQRG